MSIEDSTVAANSAATAVDAVIDDQWSLLAGAGTWMTGDERIDLIRITRDRTDHMCGSARQGASSSGHGQLRDGEPSGRCHRCPDCRITTGDRRRSRHGTSQMTSSGKEIGQHRVPLDINQKGTCAMIRAHWNEKRTTGSAESDDNVAIVDVGRNLS